MAKITFTVYSILIFILLGRLQATATTYPDSIRVPVTFYDFHADGSNPDFNANNRMDNNRRYHMADSILGTQGKPLLGPNHYFSCFLSKWFVPWSDGDSSIAVYNDSGACTAIVKAGHDTAYKNIVVQDTLIFRFIRGTQGAYQYVNDQFFPLDGRGFGAEGKNHNYSFSMEVHWQFTKNPGLKFYFTGSGDLWAFINNKCVADIGGVHQVILDSAVVDKIPGLDAGKRYDLDIFYCNRQLSQSSIRMTIGIISVSYPCDIYLQVYTDSVLVEPGDSISLRTGMFDDTAGIRPEYYQYITWSLIGDTNAGFLKTSTGAINTFYAKRSIVSTVAIHIAVYFEDYWKSTCHVVNPYDTIKVIVRPKLAAIKDQRTSNRLLPSSFSHDEDLTVYSLTGKRVRVIKNGISEQLFLNGSKAGLAGGVYFVADKNKLHRVLKRCR